MLKHFLVFGVIHYRYMYQVKGNEFHELHTCVTSLTIYNMANTIVHSLSSKIYLCGNMFSAILICGLVVLANGMPTADEQYPTIQWFDCEDVEACHGFDKCMNLIMPNGMVKKVRMVMEHGNPNILIGDVVGDDDSHISVTIHDGEVEVMINDPVLGFVTFMYNEATGKSVGDFLTMERTTMICQLCVLVPHLMKGISVRH